MNAFVIDASFVIEAFTVKGRARSQMRSLLADAEKGSVRLHAPSLLPYEFANALLHAKYAQGELDALYVQFESLNIEFATPSSILLRTAADSAHRLGSSVYDMAYHQLALLVGGTLVTCDAKYFARAKSLGSIELVPIA